MMENNYFVHRLHCVRACMRACVCACVCYFCSWCLITSCLHRACRFHFELEPGGNSYENGNMLLDRVGNGN